MTPSSRRSISLLGFLLVMILGAAMLRSFLGASPLPQAVDVHIPPGSGARQAARILADRGVIRSAPVFLLLAHLAGSGTKIRAGEYRFQGPTTTRQVLQTLVAGQVLLHSITLPEGMSRLETVQLLANSRLEIQGDLQAASRDISLLAGIDAAAEDLEGYLFPDTYRFPRGIQAEVVFHTLVQRFKQVMDDLVKRDGSPQQGTRAWVILASLVEKETGLEAERSQIASVFSNRLKKGMLLQCDPTVLYALKRQQVEFHDALAHHLDIEDPYNTYLHAGLPPGPIASPGRQALRAAQAPAATQDLYFVATGQGGHTFSSTLAAHQRAVHRLKTFQRARPRRQVSRP